MGLSVSLAEGVGPVLDAPLRAAGDLRRLYPLQPDEALPWALESIRLVRAALDPERAVVGFVGGPFTVAGYLIEGGPSRTFAETKRCMYAEPGFWHGLMERLADAFGAYAGAQVGAGADVIQIFDSWVGALSAADYREFVAPYSARILRPSTCRRSTSPPGPRICSPSSAQPGRRRGPRLAPASRAGLAGGRP